MKPEKLPLQSADGAQINLDMLYQIAPSCFTEARGADGKVRRVVNFDVLRQLLGDAAADTGEEFYQFTWPGKAEARREAARSIRKTLRPVPEDSVDWDTTQNLYIEGDNLEVLKLLQKSYMGKVKMIYIDPPYNTGNDFVYNDNFAATAADYDRAECNTDELGNRYRKNTDSNGRFHSDWCSMIYPRLQLARNLLAEDGVVLINMDENEITNLVKICNEVFGESNDLGTIIWDKRNPKGDAQGISYQHESIVIFAKDIIRFKEVCKILRPKKNAKSMIEKARKLFSKVSKTYSLEDVNNDFAFWLSQQPTISGGERAYNKIDENGELYQSVSMAWPNKKQAPSDYFIPLIHPITGKPCPVPSRGWRNPSSTMQELLSKGMILFGLDETTQPRRKYLLSENMFENIPSLLYFGGSDVDMLHQLGIPFDTPKVVYICKEHIQAFSKNDSIILDFFSGSATTAHAVMKLNAEDGGKRKFIMVQLPEPTEEGSEARKAGYENICEIGKERSRRAGRKIKEEAGLQGQNLDTGFRVFRVDESNMEDVYFQPASLSQDQLDLFLDNVKPGRTDLDLLFGAMLDWGVQLSLPMSKTTIDNSEVYTVNEGDLVACFAENITENVIAHIADQSPLRVLFRDSCFKTDADKINIFEQFKQRLGWSDEEAMKNIRVI